MCKPLTMVALIGLASVLDVDGDDRAVLTWVVVALALSLVGDVFLMLPERSERAVATCSWPGWPPFLLGHLAYVVGVLARRCEAVRLAAGLVVGGARGRHHRPPHRRAPSGRSDEPELGGPGTAYLAVISLMVVSAVGTGEPLAIVGAGLFYCSDALIAWNRFVHPQAHGRLAVIVTYHLAQILLVLSLTT